MKNVKLITLLLGIIASAPLPLLAKQEGAQEEPLPWYQVELIVFEPFSPATTNEKWPVVIEESRPLDIVELSAPIQSGKSTKPVAFQLLNTEELEMKNVVASLQKNDNHNVMLHIAWRQPLEENAGGQPVHVHSELKNNFLISQHASPAQQNKPVLLNSLPDPEGEVENFVDGTITLSLTRFLHLKTHMVYFNPDIELARQIAEQETDNPVIQRFLLKESRRVKRKELHYLDHPYFGIIARVTRYETEAEKQAKTR